MNYEIIYESIISSRKENKPTGVVERHHIVPRCLGGDDSTENVIAVTPREHYVCHYLLAKMHGGSLWAAYYLMSHPKTNSGREIFVTSKMYETARKNYISYLKTKTGEKNPNFGNVYSKQAREKISRSRKKYVLGMHPRAINSDCEWRHVSGEIFIGSHFLLSAATGICSNGLRRASSGQVYSFRGWSCASSGRKNMRSGDNNNTSDKKIYTWVSPNGKKFEGTRSYAKENLGLASSGTSNLVRGIIKKHKGWSVCL